MLLLSLTENGNVNPNLDNPESNLGNFPSLANLFSECTVTASPLAVGHPSRGRPAHARASSLPVLSAARAQSAEGPLRIWRPGSGPHPARQALLEPLPPAASSRRGAPSGPGSRGSPVSGIAWRPGPRVQGFAGGDGAS